MYLDEGNLDERMSSAYKHEFQVQHENDASHAWRILVGEHARKRKAENDTMKINESSKKALSISLLMHHVASFQSYPNNIMLHPQLL